MKYIGLTLTAVTVVCALVFVSSWLDAWIWNSVDFLESIRHLAWHEIFRVKLLLAGAGAALKVTSFRTTG